MFSRHISQPSHRRLHWTAIAAFIVAVASFAALWLSIFRDRVQMIPFYADATAASHERWQAFGGAWNISGGSVRNESSERGAKLITGSANWSDYALDADLQLLGPGDAGVLVRVSDAEAGVDSYTGYYIGLRTTDDTFIIGRARHGWLEFPTNAKPVKVKPFEWYHLHVTAVGCKIEARVVSHHTGQESALSIVADECYPSGKVGLRSYSAGGVWRNIAVTAARDSGGQQRMAKAMPLPVFDHLSPARNLRGSYLLGAERRPDSLTSGDQPAALPISSLRLLPNGAPKPVTIRGLVILSSPDLIVQDNTGGVSVVESHGPPLKVGDEVEVRGRVSTSGFHSILRDAEVQLLWEGEPPPPYSVTLNGAASGAYDSTFVEVEALLRGKRQGANGRLLLDMDGRNQSFQAILDPGRSAALVQSLGIESTLRLRGICVADSRYTANINPFALLVRSAEDVQVVAGPPLWSLHFLLRVLLAVTVLALFAYVLYLRARNWRMGAVLEERGRLAHEIHDTLAQSFAGIGFQLQAIRKRLPTNDLLLHEQVELACSLVRHSHEETRRSIATLRHEPAGSSTLSDSLRECAQRMVGNGALDISVAPAGQACILPLQVESALLRIGQEAMANAVSHSGASHVSIRVSFERDAVALRIQDDGCGFQVGSKTNGFGLAGIQRRAASIGAAISIQSNRRGTLVEVIAPICQPRRWTQWLTVRRKQPKPLATKRFSLP